jgi:hypothetical protein
VCQGVKSASPTREARALTPHLARGNSKTAFAEAQPAAKAFQNGLHRYACGEHGAVQRDLDQYLTHVFQRFTCGNPKGLCHRQRLGMVFALLGEVSQYIRAFGIKAGGGQARIDGF